VHVESEKGISVVSGKLSREEKIKALLEIVEKIAKGAHRLAERRSEDLGKWAGRIKGAVDKLLRIMREYAERGDFEGMVSYYENAMYGSNLGRRVAKILEKHGRKSLESEYFRVKELCEK